MIFYVDLTSGPYIKTLLKTWMAEVDGATRERVMYDDTRAEVLEHVTGKAFELDELVNMWYTFVDSQEEALQLKLAHFSEFKTKMA